MTIPGIPDIDTSRPNVARVCDALLGGRDTYAADRELAERLLEICPSLRDAVRDNRAFIERAVTWAARQGIRQFADLGTGMPTRPSIGEAIRTVIPDARIAYVDHDPVVIAIAGALLADDEGTAAVDANLADPASVLTDPAFRAVIDPAEPVCLVFGLVLGLLPGRQARQVVAGYADLVAPGSYVVLSCGRCDYEELWKQLSDAFTTADSYNHSPDEVKGFFAGVELVLPGLVAAQNWRGGCHNVPAAAPGPAYVLARGRAEEVTAPCVLMGR
jgi:O-methyltransferase involved in polyketide biosynthesis